MKHRVIHGFRPLRPGDVIRGDRNAPGGFAVVKHASDWESFKVRVGEAIRRLRWRLGV